MNPLLLPALSMGLFGGVHCVAMCGGASSVLCANKTASGRFAIAFNAGRVLSYTALGFAAGALGSWTVGHQIDPLRFAFRMLAAICMVTVGLHLAGLPSFVRALESIGAPLWRHVAPLARRLLPLRTPWHALAAGGLWSLMPCGLLYAALALSASAESAVDGGTTMAAFAVGTLPIMLSVGAVAARVTRAMSRRWIRRLAGVVVLAFGLWSTAGLAGQAGLGPLGSALSPACCPHP